MSPTSVREWGEYHDNTRYDNAWSEVADTTGVGEGSEAIVAATDADHGVGGYRAGDRADD